ncbi:MAG: hypothetical protein JJU12_03825 [Chlamydiales bacterium]|nr:hypothetical protein [Chlamydiales bacterium]
MKITNDRIEISGSESIPWEDVKTLRLLNEKLALVLTDGRVIELSNVRASTIDTAFRAYERYLKDHSEKRKH